MAASVGKRRAGKNALRDVGFVDRVLRKHERGLRQQDEPASRAPYYDLYGPKDGHGAQAADRQLVAVPGHTPNTRSSRERKAARAKASASKQAGGKKGRTKVKVPAQRDTKAAQASKK